MSKLRKAAQGQQCTLMIFPYCDWVEEKVVLAHLPSEDKGMGNKSPDWWAVHACDSCHAIIDGRSKVALTQSEIDECVARGLYRTWKRNIEAGLIKIKGVNL